MPRVAIVGLGYFSQFHQAAWSQRSDTEVVAVCDRDLPRAQEAGRAFGCAAFDNVPELIKETDPDIVDLILPPVAQSDAIRSILAPGRWIICQKPFGTSMKEAEDLTDICEAAGTKLVIHENFRFQPWYRTMHRFLSEGGLGNVWSAQFQLRPGDGRGSDAYLARQPTFQKMPRFLVQETAVHLIDTFRFLFGPITNVFAQLRRLNPVIAGEDSGHLIFNHASGLVSHFDGNRLSDHVAEDARRTMGIMQVEGEKGALGLDGDGNLWIRKFGESRQMPLPVTDPVDNSQFGGGCVAALIDHVVQARGEGTEPENSARDYLSVLRIVDAAYESAVEGKLVSL